jgi:hypothetical protein
MPSALTVKPHIRLLNNVKGLIPSTANIIPRNCGTIMTQSRSFQGRFLTRFLWVGHSGNRTPRAMRHALRPYPLAYLRAYPHSATRIPVTHTQRPPLYGRDPARIRTRHLPACLHLPVPVPARASEKGTKVSPSAPIVTPSYLTNHVAS